jgi:hypothetical protein
VPGPIRDVVIPVARPAHQLQDDLEYFFVAALIAGADQVRFANSPLFENEVDRGVVIVDVGPFADVQS